MESDVPADVVVRQMLAELGELAVPDSEAGCIDVVAALEALKGAAAAAQARATARLVTLRQSREEAAGVPAGEWGRGLGAEVALARRSSPSAGDRFVGMARALSAEMPATMGLLAAGEVSEWTATCLVRETAVLSVADRGEVDARLAGVLAGLSTRQATGRARAIARELDQAALVERATRALSERRVWLRPKPDGMSLLSALLPMHEGVAVYAALRKAAGQVKAGAAPAPADPAKKPNPNQSSPATAGAVTAEQAGQTDQLAHDNSTGTAKAAPADPDAHAEATVPAQAAEPAGPQGAGAQPAAAADPADRDLDGEREREPERRGLGQLMADLLVERLTGQAKAEAVPVEVSLVMPAESLFGVGNEPAQLAGPGLAVTGEQTLAAPWALELLSRCEDAGAELWLRRVFTTPDGSQLAGLDPSRSRFYAGMLRKAVVLRDQECRASFCDAPVRHIDHVERAADGGQTSSDNGLGGCERHNYTKEYPGWSGRVRLIRPDTTACGDGDHGSGRPVHEFTLRTPTGHEYTSIEPPILPGRTQPGQQPPTPPPPGPKPERPARGARQRGQEPRQQGREAGQPRPREPG
ncbi:DUF222 domain-containing protein [Actinomycetota bacterium]